MKFHPLPRRAALLFAVTLTLGTLSSCVKDNPQPSAPGPHQGYGVKDGKETVARSPGPHQGN